MGSPADDIPSKNYLRHFYQQQQKVTCDMWHVIQEMDTWHMAGGRRGKHYLTMSNLLWFGSEGVLMIFLEKDHWFNELMDHWQN